MSLQSSIFSKLSGASSATAALIGSESSCALYPGVAPDKPALPYVVMSVIASQPEVTHEASSDFDLTDVQFSIVAATYTAAVAIRKAIRTDLSDVVLADGEKPVDFTERDGFSDALDAHAVNLDVSIWNNPSAA